jgi:hypothetical protein
MNKIALAPTTLPNAPPLEYIDAAMRVGYSGGAGELAYG